MNLVRQSTSKEPIKTHIEAEEAGVAVDPSGDTITWAFTATDDLTGAQWQPGSWEVATGADGQPEYWACYQLPGTMAKGVYVMHVKIAHSGSVVPALRVGTLKLL